MNSEIIPSTINIEVGDSQFFMVTNTDINGMGDWQIDEGYVSNDFNNGSLIKVTAKMVGSTEIQFCQNGNMLYATLNISANSSGE